MRRVTAGVCALLMATAPLCAGATTQLEQDGKSVMSYMMRVLNAKSTITSTIKAQMRSGKFPAEATPYMETAFGFFDVEEPATDFMKEMRRTGYCPATAAAP